MTRDFHAAGPAHYEIRFRSLFDPGRSLAFPCDREGHVDFETFSARARINYLYARAMVGREYDFVSVRRHSWSPSACERSSTGRPSNAGYVC